MRQGGAEEKRQKRRHTLWYSVLTVALPVFAAALAAAFVLLCAAYGSVRPGLTIELGEGSPEAGAFLRRSDGTAAYVVEPEAIYYATGDYRLRIETNGRTVPVVLHVRDTEPPTADGVETTVGANERLTPDKLLRSVRDNSVVKVSYEKMPPYGTVGDHEAIILLEDESGNTSRVRTTVHVRTAVDELVFEAGAPVPALSDFLIGTYADVQSDTITEEMMHTPGTYPIGITADGITAQSLLIIRDTVPPQASGTTYIAVPGEEVLPEQLVTGVTDETAVTAAFVREPDRDSLAPQTVGVILTDLGGNTVEVESTLLFSNVKPVQIEARTAPLSAEELLEDGSYTEASLNMLYIPDDPGLHVLAVTIDGRQNLALVEITDTTPPVITPADSRLYLNTPVGVDAVAHVSDVTETVAAFLTEPDWSLETQDVTVTATDSSGNTSELTFALTLVPDTEPPTLYGVRDRVVYTGEPVAYLADVSALDNCDGTAEVTVDTSRVDPERSGKYRVTYTATDRAGNTASRTAVFTFVTPKYSEEEANAVAQKVLQKILTDDMTLPEQVEAIYNYVFRNVRYNWQSNKLDWRSEAVRGLTVGRGDCFTAYAAARLLLEQTDAQIVSVQRSKPNTHHYWLLVNVGTGWYHFDACNYWSGKSRCFMWTDAQTRRVSKSYWRYDKSLYPPVATEPYNGGN